MIMGTFNGEIEEMEDDIDKRFKQIKNFDTISNPPFDHHFIDYKRPTFTKSSSSLTQKIQQEWKMLETNLPNSILVRAYQNRIDLMRAVVLGPPGTPYYHGLFFFDILFPSNYPVSPPKLFYRSQGFDLNPNLHPEGKVYLSLLEPWYRCLLLRCWYGCNIEKWNPNQSNLLQVLVSIQCRVLNAKPYINEPVRQYILRESEVLKYNQKAFVSTCKAMIWTLKRPPKHFEDFVAGHFRQRAHPILMNYKVHMGGSECLMEGLFLTLMKAFEANGAYCTFPAASPSHEQMQLESCL